ncbi:MAG: sugar ABC transporter ATP-binding protein [Planctomycetota bacterium]|nr:sugar ABC transporter ATP-binding protein [Planctomycetota bacterium]
MDSHPAHPAPPKLSMRGISKAYPGVQALQDVDLDLESGQILGLVGENGAGKSTLIKILAGATAPDNGQILLDGKAYQFETPLSARRKGIAIIYQEMSLIPSLSVWENMFLSRRGWVRRREEIAETRRLVNLLGVDINPKTLCRDLSIGEMQVVEIAAALRTRSQILVLDEPSTALSNRETERLRTLLFKLRDEGMAIIYISHRLEEILEWTDRIQVLRDGRSRQTFRTRDIDRSDLIRAMVGEDLVGEFPGRRGDTGSVCLKVSNLCRGDAVRQVSFQVKAGEIVALTGLVGSGRSEVLRLLGGVDRATSGSLEVHGRSIAPRTPREALREGICLLPEDRKSDGLFLKRNVRENFALPNLQRFSRWGLIDQSAESAGFCRYAERIKLDPDRSERLALTLSGGNQQKLLFARWLCMGCDVILLDEPTRGIDVAARYEIYQLVRVLTEEGKAIVMVSSDLSEVMGMADRILVMRHGAIAGQFSNVASLRQRDVMEVAFGAVS